LSRVQLKVSLHLSNLTSICPLPSTQECSGATASIQLEIRQSAVLAGPSELQRLSQIDSASLPTVPPTLFSHLKISFPAMVGIWVATVVSFPGPGLTSLILERFLMLASPIALLLELFLSAPALVLTEPHIRSTSVLVILLCRQLMSTQSRVKSWPMDPWKLDSQSMRTS
jgi:hypothetical protein